MHIYVGECDTVMKPVLCTLGVVLMYIPRASGTLENGILLGDWYSDTPSL